jgi:hypothetical protein
VAAVRSIHTSNSKHTDFADIASICEGPADLPNGISVLSRITPYCLSTTKTTVRYSAVKHSSTTLRGSAVQTLQTNNICQSIVDRSTLNLSVPAAVEFYAAKIDDNKPNSLSTRSLTIQERNQFRSYFVVGFGLSSSDNTTSYSITSFKTSVKASASEARSDSVRRAFKVPVR